MRRAAALIGITALLATTGCTASTPAEPRDAALSATVDDRPTAIAISDGDLWPSCWSDDGALYTANGDGAGFGYEFSDVVMNRVTGTPEADDLDGEALALGDDLGQVWSGEGFTRKPTGMLCTDGSLYLAVQDLALDFNSAPAATVARSDDHGRTWSWDRSAPMFDDGVFTTIWFADFGKDAASAPDPEFAYAFGLDGNWRDSFTDAVPDPTELFLARVPTASVQDVATWEFYAGEPGDVEATWTDGIGAKRPVLVDERRQHPSDEDAERDEGGNGQTVGAHDLSVLSQGGVTYLPGRDRYLYTSWTEFTFEFYESPTPWGPWSLLLSEDFGAYPWSEDRIGGYGTTIPSKFVSDDETTLWLQSNVCPCAPAGASSYWFGLREMTLE
ncbi:hypothetical protein HD600_001017 [Microbacterium ginsengiterrae]|uniref:DUF4185 domain-containing protein n=1 Tax=Microbacterium ginsengiterrae TaxID=546115 RepID=A0A7W9CBF2_9MICO|nr:DUF4185 domain-containing protein [Microbacterium ginsengiterrae]MBB5742520.1 hypothetical protein [Microbacterium ginsengiterrae]